MAHDVRSALYGFIVLKMHGESPNDTVVCSSVGTLFAVPVAVGQSMCTIVSRVAFG